MVIGLTDQPQTDAREIAEAAAFLAVDHPDARTWNQTITDLHPHFPYEYYKTFAGNVILVVSLIFPAWIVSPLVTFLLNTLMNDPSMETAKIWARD